MCGILFSQHAPLEAQLKIIKRRGPHAQSKIPSKIGTFAGSVLSLRGGELISQPLISNDSILLWNGTLSPLSNSKESFMNAMANLNQTNQILFSFLKSC
jgi:asparagine synthetase B (glutamine-hydrolysing)